jgi:hypothetical protein
MRLTLRVTGPPPPTGDLKLAMRAEGLEPPRA